MRKKRILLLCAIVTAPYCFLRISFNYHLNSSDEDFTNVHLCPACYGESLCPQFFHGDIHLTGISRLKYFQFFNRKNVYDAKLYGNRVVLKKLAHDWEINDLDQHLCKQAKLNEHCDVRSAVKHLCKDVNSITKPTNLTTIFKAFHSPTDIAKCPSERLLRHVWNRCSDHSLESNLNKTAELMYTMLVNPEPIILQAFPQNEGWPFPLYKGSCGRVIAEEYIGRTLAYYESAPWEQRLDLAYQLLQVALLLTNNLSGFALYMTDVNMDNFAVRPDGTIFLIDVENIIIVDRWEVKKGHSKDWNGFHTSMGEACDDCLNFSVDDLCSYDMSDHNYYAICKGLLVPGAYYSSKGLLHSIPPLVEKRTNLSHLLKECAHPRTKMDRFNVVPKILQTMKSLL